MIGRLWLQLAGWRLEGALPPGVTKGVVIAAPHTSNWDLVFMLAVAYALGVRPSWLGKRELFRFPFGGVMRLLGGVPVDRSRRTNLVDQAVARLREATHLFLVIPPSGTRSRAAHWKSGFYHIARGAGVPIICSFLDYRRKVGGIGLSFVPTGDVCADMDKIRAFYGTVTARFPDQVTPMRIREEDEPEPIAVGER